MHRLPRALAFPRQPSQVSRWRPPLHTPRIQRRWKSRTPYGRDGEPMRHQVVRFKSPSWSLRRVVTLGLYTGAAYGFGRVLWRQLDIEIEFVEEEELAQNQQGQNALGEADEAAEEGPFYADENSIFIPLTWSKQMPRSYYRGTDPEWSEFIRVAKDPPRQKLIYKDLTTVILTGSAQHPPVARHLGADPKIGKYWLDISFPDGPPLEYERQGIEIGDGFVAWSTQKVDAEKQWRTQRALVPKAAASGIWAASKVMAGIQWRRVKQYLGWEEVNPMSVEERFRLAIAMSQREDDKSRRPKQTSPGTPTAAPNAAASTATTNPITPPKSNLPWHLPNVKLPYADPDADTSSSPPLDITIARHVFSATLSKLWNPKKAEAPRGTFLVEGIVEVNGGTGKVIFDVSGFYDPRANKFVNINAGIRKVKRWKQRPKGGP
ncbi:hypothetical protein BDY17DRAFT_298259 [Neohortaea acidophila]|uniref:Uncharacterized protein n=1 Tax=Neohortaea acidophila TaxID=245834 RepID=A0A6A6PQ94_9PEZI|nr:uncharacterized protein BDY17DRAFT_298259 [Neohortaea acidophila]KAF2482280.1 hypothetical protein BDY17DRAFT_298259 [Neohortaea acidophila]